MSPELRRAVRLLEVDPRRFALAVLLGVGALGSAVALAAVSAWLIARASQMPPVLHLSVATVAVRAFGVGRGVLRYLERIASHELALRGMTALRTTLYARLASGRPEAALRVRRGDLLARVGADVDAVGDMVVRGILPAAVAAVLGLGTSIAMACFLPAAGLVLALCLLLAGVLAPWLAARTARSTELRAAEARADMTSTALGLLDDAGPLTVAGRAQGELEALSAADRRIAAAVDAGAGPAAIASALGSLAQGLAVLGALLLGIPAVGSGAMTPVELAVIVLTPLAAFEAVSVLPSAAVQGERSRAAARRILALLDDAADELPASASPSSISDSSRVSPSSAPSPVLRAHALDCGWSGRPLALAGLELEVHPGRSVAIVGASGAGKTTALLTLAGLLEPRGGTVTVDGSRVAGLDREARVGAVTVTTEDAHVFGTTVLENLRVARGDLDEERAREALRRVGLDDWLKALPQGLDTLLASDGRTVSGGERRRLLLARALVGPSRILLVDEPAEHLDPATADELVTALLTEPRDLDGSPRGVVLATHRLAPLAAADEVILLREGRVAARGSHEDLLTDPGYREAWERELAEERAG